MIKQIKINTDIGKLYLVASSKGLRGVDWKKDLNIPFSDSSVHDDIIQILSKAIYQLNEYIGGVRKKFNIPLDIIGGDFDKCVWNALMTIPYGETCSYKDLAKKINNPKAYRAVGSANHRNPLCIIIPCHRVVNANGNLGGYSGGLQYKKKLLRLEQGGHF